MKVLNSKSVHIIAEAGTNHGGDRVQGELLVNVAKEAGADSVKFQLIYPEGLYLPKFFVEGAYVPNEVFAKRRAAMLSDDDWRRLRDFAAAAGMPFSASVFDRRGLDFLDEIEAPYIKIASCDLNHLPFLREAASRGRRVILSTGMATLEEIELSVRAMQAAGPLELVLMHCVSVYPCPVERMNLSFLETLHQTFGLPIGLSDHTESSLAAAVAIGKGATWIEKHFTLDRTAVGFDHAYSMEPAMLSQYIADVRSCEAACRPAKEKVHSSEASVRQRARRALYAARDLQPGEILAEADLLIVRPEGPLSPGAADRILGRPLKRAFHQFEPLTWDGVAA